MTFFNHHPLRKSSEKPRTRDEETVSSCRKSESNSSRAASLPETETKSAVDLDLEGLFHQATVTTVDDTGADSSQEQPNIEETRFSKTGKCNHLHPRLYRITEGIRRSFSNRRERHHTPGNPGPRDSIFSRCTSPEIASDTAYDSDAAFIASPRFSEQSWDSSRDSSHPTNSARLERTITSLNQILADGVRKPDMSNDLETVILPVENTRRSALSVLKRRKKIENTADKNDCSDSRAAVGYDIKTKKGEPGTTVFGGRRQSKSRFTEMFHHNGLKDDASTRHPRKVSIGWMSEGKRCGYGYSFVEQGEAIVASDEEEAPEDGSSGAEKMDHNRDAAECREDQSTVDAASAQTDTVVRDEHELDAQPDPESSPEQHSRWTIFPSHTAAARNQSVDLEDDIIVRDFCTKASPDRPQAGDEESNPKKQHLLSNALRQGIHDTFLWVMGLGKREIARYHAGMEVSAARSHDSNNPVFDNTVSLFYENAPKEELGDFHMEAWKAARRRSRSKKRSNNLRRFRVSVSHAVGYGAMKTHRKSNSSSSSPTSTAQHAQKMKKMTSLTGLDGGASYIGRRHSATF